TDIVVGFSVSKRRGEPDNLVALRCDLSGNPEFRELLRSVREAVKAAYANCALPFQKIVAELASERNASYAPIFQVMFDYNDSKHAKEEVSELRGQTIKQDLRLSLVKAAGGLSGWLDFSTALFDGERIARMAEHLETLLKAVAQNPAARLSALPLL